MLTNQPKPKREPSHAIVNSDSHHAKPPKLQQPGPTAHKQVPNATTYELTTKMRTNGKVPPLPTSAVLTNQSKLKRESPHTFVNMRCHRTKPPYDQLLPFIHEPTHTPIYTPSGMNRMSDSEEEDSPAMNFISEMLQGQEETLEAARTFSIIIWPDATSTQKIEGWGGERSRNSNGIAKAMKTAITGSIKGPCISSHPHHINIIDKLDGTPTFQCMRVNFDSRADRNLFCQAKLVISQLRMYNMFPQPPLATTFCPQNITQTPITTLCHHLVSPPHATGSSHYPLPPSPTTTLHHHPMPPPLDATHITAIPSSYTHIPHTIINILNNKHTITLDHALLLITGKNNTYPFTLRKKPSHKKTYNKYTHHLKIKREKELTLLFYISCIQNKKHKENQKEKEKKKNEQKKNTKHLTIQLST